MRDRELHTIDALDELGVAPSLASSDFYRRASQSLTADGALVGRIRSVVASRATCHYRAGVPPPEIAPSAA